MIRGLFARLLVALCGVAAASTGLVLVLQERSLSSDLERAATQRLENAAAAAEQLLNGHLDTIAERYHAVAGTPQFRATLEVNDGPTLAHYAGSLLQRHGATRIAFVGLRGDVVAGAGEVALDAAALALEGRGVVAHAGKLHAVVRTSLARSGELVAVETIGSDTLDLWSELCGARVVFAPPTPASADRIERTLLRAGGDELRVTSSLETERTAMANARRQLATAAALGLALAFVVSIAVSRSLVRPIQELQQAARRIGGGDLTTQVGSNRSDEIGDVARTFDEMSAELGATIRRVVEAADRVEATAIAIGEGTQHLLSVAQQQRGDTEETVQALTQIHERVHAIAASAEESASRLDASVGGSTASFRQLAQSGETLRESSVLLEARTEEINTSVAQASQNAALVASDTEHLMPAVDSTVQRVGEMAAAAREVNAHAEETSRLSDAVVGSARESREIVADAVSGMQSTRETIEQSDQVIRELGRSVEKIGDILTVIDDVTQQTGLLALNGSIIASQAGEHGRAFSVVADQLGALAHRVQGGTREIEDVVRAVQSKSARAVESIGRGFERADAGAELVLRARHSLDAIIESAHESVDRMTESASATARQIETADAISGEMAAIRESVDRIRAATRGQADANHTVEEGAAALRHVVKEIRDSVDLQARESSQIGSGVEVVQGVVREITSGLDQQVTASDQAAGVLRGSLDHTRSHEESAQQMEEAAGALEREAQALREVVRRFCV